MPDEVYRAKELREFWRKRNCPGPDARPMHLYLCDDDEYAALGQWLKPRLQSRAVSSGVAGWFALWAVERIRRFYAGGGLTWAFVFAGVSVEPDQRQAATLAERGLLFWRRPLRRSAMGGGRHFLYSLMAEGGLPDALLARESGYSAALLGTIADIGAMGAAAALTIARRWLGALPQVYQEDQAAELLAELAQAIIGLRAELPEGVAGALAENWLNLHRPGWEAGLPLRLSEPARVALLRPALSEDDALLRHRRQVSQRLLHRRADGVGWAGAIRIPNGVLLPHAMLPVAAGHRVLRLVAEQGPVFRAVAEAEGWSISGGRQAALLALAPDRACILAAYADGRLLGECVLAAGLPSPEEAPTLWRASAPGDQAVELVPASSRGTAAGRLWLLAPAEAAPVFSEGVQAGEPEPAPNGRLWPVSGQGTIRCGEITLKVETGCGRDQDPATLLPLAATLRGWTAENGLPVFCGTLRFLGLRGEHPARDLTQRVRLRDMRGTLAGRIVEWPDEDGASQARVALVALPTGFSFEMREAGTGCAAIRVEGLPAGWHVRANAGGLAVDLDPAVGSLLLRAGDGLPAMVTAVLSDPATGRTLHLSAPWPSRDPVLIDPTGQRLAQSRAASLSSLTGWRGVVPAAGGALELRMAGRAVGFGIGGMQRLSAWSGLLAQAMALAGADGTVELCLACGVQTPRLDLRRYDWPSTLRGDRLELGIDPVRLRAITLEPPHLLRETEANGEIRLSDWLGDLPQLWFIQGRSERGVMRAEAWSARPRPRSSRPHRIAAYHAEFRAMLEDVSHPGWAQLIALIRLAREAGDAGALDQLQALPGVPAIAVALLFRMRPGEIVQTLDIETEAPFWWPLLPCNAWSKGLAHARRHQLQLLVQAGLVGRETEASVAEAVQRRIASVLRHRPELKAHFGVALFQAGFSPVAGSGDMLLLARDPEARLLEAARSLAARAPAIPQGVTGISAPRIAALEDFSPDLRPILDAPVAAAAMAARDTRPAAEDVLRLLALRHADPQWFDDALPLALQLLAMKMSA